MSPRNKNINQDDQNLKHSNKNESNRHSRSPNKKNKLSFWMRKIMLSNNSGNNTTSNNNNKQETTTQRNILVQNKNNKSKLTIPNRKSTTVGTTSVKPKKRYSFSHTHNHPHSQNQPLLITTTQYRHSQPQLYYDNDSDSTLDYERLTSNASIRPIFHNDMFDTGTTPSRNMTSSGSMRKLQWDNDIDKMKLDHSYLDNHNHNSGCITNTGVPPIPTTPNGNNTTNYGNDIASMAPMISFYSSSVRSPSMFSDNYSIQSTRPTVMSIKTTETNSSVMAIPPASIIDRARPPTHNLESSASITS